MNSPKLFGKIDHNIHKKGSLTIRNESKKLKN